MSAKRALTNFRAPGEQATSERAWHAVRSAYREHEPRPRRPVARAYAGVVAASIVLVVGAVLSPAGATVGRLVNRALGRQTVTETRERTLLRPQALVTDEAENRVLVVDLPSGHVAASLPVAADPEDIAASGNGGIVVVVSSRAGTVTLLNRDTLKTIKTIGGFEAPHIVEISPDGAYAYVTDDSRGTLTVIRLSDMRVTSTVSVGASAHHLTFSPNGHSVWVALGETASQITLLSTAVHAPQGVTGKLYDPGRPHVIGHFSPGFPAHDLGFSPDGRSVWVTSASGPDVTAFSARTHRVLFRIPVGAPPQHVVFEGRYAYLTSGYGSVIEKVAVTTGKLLSRAASPYGSFELDAADGYVVTSSLLRGTLAVYTPNLKLLTTVTLAPTAREVTISRP